VLGLGSACGMSRAQWIGQRGESRARRLGSVSLGALLALVLLAGFAGSAYASAYDMRGEWSLLLTAAKQPPLPGTVVIAQMKVTGAESSEFSGNALFGGPAFGGYLPGTFSGTLSGNEAFTTIVTATPGGILTFKTTTATLDPVANSLSGPGIYYLEGKEFETGALTAKRLATYTEVQEKEAKEKAAREKEAKEKAAKEKEAQEKAAKEKAAKEKEAQEKAAKEKAAKEAEKSSQTGGQSGNSTPKTPAVQSTTPPPSTTITAPALLAKAFAASSAGSISLSLTNANSVPIVGNLTLSAAVAATAGNTHYKRVAPMILGSASFTISAHGTTVVKVKLSRKGRAELTRRKTLHVVMKIVTHAQGQTTSTTKTYSLTLHASTPRHRRHR
jgi:hypothetical protein